MIVVMSTLASPDVLVAGALLAAPAAAQPPAADTPMTLQAVLDQARASTASSSAPRSSRPILPIEDRKQAQRGAAAVGQRLHPIHLHRAERHAVRCLGAERRPEHLRDVAQRARRRVLAAEMGGVPRRRRRRSGRARPGRRRRARPRRRRSCRTTTRWSPPHASWRARSRLCARRSSFSTSHSSRRAAARSRTPTCQGADSGRAAHARRAGSGADRAQEPARAVGAVFPDFRDSFSVVDDLQTLAPLLPLADVKSTADHEQPGAARRRSVGAAGDARRRRRARRRAAVAVVRLFLRHQREPVRHLRSAKAIACSARSRRCSSTCRCGTGARRRAS